MRHLWYDETAFGGSVLREGGKKARPLSANLPIHLVLRSSRAVGKWSFLRKEGAYAYLIRRLAIRYSVKIYRLANVGNHFHLLLSIKDRAKFQNFLRVLTPKIAYIATGIFNSKKLKQFWDAPAFTTIVKNWGKDFESVDEYVLINQMEGKGVPRKLMNDWRKSGKKTFVYVFGGKDAWERLAEHVAASGAAPPVPWCATMPAQA